MGIQDMDNGIKTDVKKKPSKKYTKLVLALLILVIIIVSGHFAWKKIENKINAPKPEPANLIEKYKEDLSNLKKQAETSGSKEDLQAYGIAQYATGDTAGAIETYTEQIEKDPRSVVAHSGLANALRDQKNFDKAIEEYKKVIEIAPGDISAYVNLASVYQYSLKQMDKALEVYQQGIDKNGASADLYILKALAYEQSDDKENAKKAYEKSIEIDSNSAAAKAGLERLAQ